MTSSRAHVRLVVATVAVAFGCGARDARLERAERELPVVPAETPEAAPALANARPCFGVVTDSAVVRDPRLTEISGMVASRREPGVLWAHNDSGETRALFFALDLHGATRAEIEIDGAPHVDWEDVARFTAPDGRELLYFADVGDNGARDGSVPTRDHVEVVVAEPPALPPGVSSSTLHVTTFDLLTFRYPDGPRDSEAIFVDAASGDLYLLSKTNEGPQGLYRDAAPHAPGETRTLERVMELLPGRSLADGITAADSDAAGNVAIRTYREAYYFPGRPAAAVREVLGDAPVEIAHLHEYQGESVAIAVDGTGLFTISEGDAQTLHFVPFVTCP